MSDEKERVEDVRLRFMEHGRALLLGKAPNGFAASFPNRGTGQASAAPHAYGATRALAAENAWATFEGGREAGLP